MKFKPKRFDFGSNNNSSSGGGGGGTGLARIIFLCSVVLSSAIVGLIVWVLFFKDARVSLKPEDLGHSVSAAHDDDTSATDRTILATLDRSRATVARTLEMLHRDFGAECNESCAFRGSPTSVVFELDRPRQRDEALFCHLPASRGGKLKSSENDEEFKRLQQGWSPQLRRTADIVRELFSLYDRQERDPAQRDSTMPVYAVPCVGIDCAFIPAMFEALNTGIGHIIVIVNTNIPMWVEFFSSLMEAFPGRFTVYLRPEKLSCAESWNLAVRSAFTIRPMPDQVFISNADWKPRELPRDVSPPIFADYARWTRRTRASQLVLNRYMHFSSYSFTRKGYLELGYFDEVIFPALTEDVEFHLKAVSKGMGELGLYPHWKNGSIHVNRASAKDKKTSRRNELASRMDYVSRKWGVNVLAHKDFALARPHKQPFNLPLAHNSSWAHDPEHWRCVHTGQGRKFRNSKRCFYDVQRALKGSGLLPKDYPVPARLMSEYDMFPTR